MEKLKIAIVTPGRFKPMGTFSRNYVQLLPFDKIFLFGGFVPFFYAGTSKIHQRFVRYFFSLISLKNEKKIDGFIKRRFKKILQKENINCVLSEFLNTGAAIREVCDELNIPIVSNVLGYEINQTDVLVKNSVEYKKLANYKCIAIPVSKQMIPKLLSLGFKEDQIIWSPLGARNEFFEIEPDYKSQVFLAIGRFTGMKSPLSTVKAFAETLKQFPNARLIFAGDGELLEQTKNFAKGLGIEKYVDFCGWISTEKQIELLQKSTVFLQHSVTTETGDAEGTPVAIIEASAAGLPIVSTNHGGIIDTVIDGKTGFLVDEHDWKAMAEKMKFLLANPLILEQYGKDGKQFILNNFSMKKHIDQVEVAIYKAVKL